MTTEPDERLLAPYRPVRRVGVDDVPWPGMLVRLIGGEARVLVDARELPNDWAGWLADPDGHVLAPLDVVRRADGHSLALPLCVERVADFIARRSAGRVPLSAGEVVTLGVSLLRGTTALDAATSMTGEWWLTDAGRPILVTQTSDGDVGAHTAELLRSMAGGTRWDASLLTAAEAASGARRSPHELRSAEEQLFATATPEPLATSVLGPRAARDLLALDREPIASLDETDRPTTWVDTIARHVDADLADVFSRATTGVWRRLRRPRTTSRRPWLLASGAAVIVLAAGLLWPTAARGPATADSPASEGVVATGATAGTAGATAGTPDIVDGPIDGGGIAAPADLVHLTEAILTARSACAEDSGCLAEVVLDPATAFERGAIDLDASDRTTTLLDDFGGMAVLRVDALDGAQPSQLVVVMLDDDRWLLRDVHLAKQP